MKLIKRLFAGFTLLGLIGGAALGQTVTQSGTVSYGHVGTWVGSGVLKDGGSASSPALNAVATYGSGGCPLSVTSTTSAGTPSGNYVQGCRSVTSSGVTDSITGAGSITTPTYTITVQGTSYTISTGSWLTNWFDSQFCSTQGSVLYRSGTAWTCLGPGNSGQVLQTQGVGQNPQWAGSGGIGTVTSITAGTGLTGGTITSSGTIALSSPVSVADGGTASSTLTAHNVVLGEGTSAVAFAAPGVAGTCLTSNGTTADPTFQSCPGTGTVTSLTGGTGIVLSPSTITSSGSIALASASAGTIKGNLTGSSAAPTDNSLSTLLRGYISGMTMSTAGSSSTFSVAAGIAMDSTNAQMMSLSAISKTTGSWAVGSGNGCLDTGSIASSSWYGVFEIERTDTGVVDVICTLETAGTPPSPSLPSNYTLERYIGSLQTDGSSHWVKFAQNGYKFLRNAMTQDVGSASLGTSAVLATLSVPLGVNVVARVRSTAIANAALASYGDILLTSPSESDQAPTNNSNSLTANASGIGAASTASASGEFNVLTNTSGQIRYRSDTNSTNFFLYINTFGWDDCAINGCGRPN